MELGVLGGMASWLFSYNRENFMNDKEQRIKRDYQGQVMQVKQFQLYREDVRDLIDLTVAKMDAFLVTGTLFVTFNLTLFTEGKPRPYLSEPWFQWIWAIFACSGIVYFLLAIWLAMHASVSAHSFGVRMLTQFVRLPLPTDKQMDVARGLADEFEGGSILKMLKFPVLRQQLKKLTAVFERTEAADNAQKENEQSPIDDTCSSGGSNGKKIETNPIAALAHVKLYRQLQSNWQAYDAYARVSLGLGVNQLLLALGYYMIGLCVAENRMDALALCCSIVLAYTCWLLFRLDLYVKKSLQHFVFLLMLFPLLLSIVCLSLQLREEQTAKRRLGERDVTDCLIPFIFLGNLAWIAISLKLAWAQTDSDTIALPRKYRSVLYLDVFGTLSGTTQEIGKAGSSSQRQAGASRNGFRGMSLSQSMTNPLRLSLLAACKRRAAQLKRDFERWECPALKAAIGEEEFFQTTVAPVRARFEDAMIQVGETAIGGTAPKEKKVVWLMLSLQMSDEQLKFYFNTSTNDTIWIAPPETDEICCFEDVERRVSEFVEKIAALVATNADQAMTKQEDDDTETADLSNSFEAEVVRNDVSTESVCELQTFFEHSSTAGNTYHPYQAPRQEGADNRIGKPGVLPWTTFRNATVVILLVWVVGCVYSVAKIWIDLDLKQGVPGPEEALEVMNPELIFAGPWPHELFSPRSIACHPRARGTVLLADTYSVYEVNLLPGGNDGEVIGERSRMRPALVDCLIRAPEFRSRGIRSVSLECFDESYSCVVVLFGGGEGDEVLRCPFGNRGNNDSQVGAFGDEHVTVHGGPWQALATAGSSTIGGGSLWAVRSEEDALIKLRYTHEAKRDAVPELALRHWNWSNVTQLHVIQRKDDDQKVSASVAASRVSGDRVGGRSETAAVLGLEPGGILRASVFGSDHPPLRKWRLFPNRAASSWSSLCSTGRELLLAGVLQTKGKRKQMSAVPPSAVWRVPLPGDRDFWR
eukprot:TRINITY_DN7496_c0_g2_i1.p1 TRINITY_DN7496_c0_g2~~TRINITY_DN7496_c0_g2_i1.p1  ORF type:complete len:982 (-),score=171.92 TRINITY_DN7496_c0_g2_i1:23-2968(-)